MRKLRHTMGAILALGFLLGGSLVQAETSGGTIISRTQAQRMGLTRAWFTQIELDRARSRIVYITQHDDMLFVQTDAGVVHALDAETGRTVWASQIGRPEHPSLAPAANDKYVAVVNGSRLYVVHRDTGFPLWDRQIGGGPGAGPALSDENVFVPLINGRLEAYDLKDDHRPPWIFSSSGRALIQPITTGRSVCWPTDRGYMYVAQTGTDLKIRFRLETNDAITSMVVYHKPFLYASSLDGYVYAVNEVTGDQVWRFSAGEPIAEPPTVIGDNLFVPTDHGGMYCISAQTGNEIWWAPRISRFLASSVEHVFATDNLGHLHVLDGQTGGRLATLPLGGMNMLLVNDTTDRIYLANDTGLVQCLHSSALDEPLKHKVEAEAGADEPAAKAPAAEEGAGEMPAEEGAPAAGENPFAPEKPAADDNPFGAPKGEAPPDGDAKTDDNPFG